MSMSKYITIILLIINTLSINAQSKKLIRNNKITSLFSNITIYENGKEINYKDGYVVYDKNGNIIEETEYFSNGSIKSKKTYKYNYDKNKVEEIEYDGKTKSTTKTINSYDSDGNKISEVILGDNDKVLKKIIYIYDNKGLRKEKKTFDENNKLISVKKYIYTKK